MKIFISLTLIILGSMLLALPLLLDFILIAMQDRPREIREAEQIACWVPGGFMLAIGIIYSFFIRSTPRTVGK